jgi:hypothetical protein
MHTSTWGNLHCFCGELSHHLAQHEVGVRGYRFQPRELVPKPLKHPVFLRSQGVDRHLRVVATARLQCQFA